jgi:UDP-N-acetylglucosamine acyltransferase
MTTQIHPTAVLEDGVELGVDVTIGPHCFIAAGTAIGDRTQIGPQATIAGRVRIGADNRIGPKINISGNTRIGDRNVIFGSASLGTAPQDLSYRGEATRLEIGDENTIREFVTVNRGTVKGGGVTRIGNNCLLMACCHVAHDCDVRNHVILANNVLLAGHVLVEDRANVAGGAAAHHFVTIGRFAYVGGVTRMPQDVPPFMIFEGHKPRVRGVNVVGLKRSGVPPERIAAVREAFRLIFRDRRPDRPRREVLAQVSALFPHVPEVQVLVESLRKTELGPKGRYRETLREEFQRQGRRDILGETV